MSSFSQLENIVRTPIAQALLILHAILHAINSKTIYLKNAFEPHK